MDDGRLELAFSAQPDSPHPVPTTELKPEEFALRRIERKTKETPPIVDGEVELHAVDGLDPYRAGLVFNMDYAEEDNKTRIRIVAADSHYAPHGRSRERIAEKTEGELSEDREVRINIDGREVEVSGRYEVATDDVRVSLTVFSELGLNIATLKKFEYAYFRTLLNSLAQGQDPAEARSRDYKLFTGYMIGKKYLLRGSKIFGRDFLDQNCRVESEAASSKLYHNLSSRKQQRREGPDIML
jgi:hypothetical protein